MPSFSLAGKRRGFDDTRGTLFFEIARVARILRPAFLLLENVKGLLNHDKGETFRVILNTLDELGYDAEWQVINSKDYVPQNRECVYIIGRLRGSGRREIFPIGPDDEETDDVERCNASTLTTRYPESQGVGSYIIESKQSSENRQIAVPVLTPDRVEKRQNGRRFKENGEPMFTLTAQDRHGVVVQVGNIYGDKNPQAGRVYDPGALSPTLDSMKGGNRQPKIVLKIQENTAKGYAEATEGDSVNIAYPNSTTRRGLVGKQIANTVLTDGSQGVVTPGMRIRKLTPRECWRLQGFPDWAFDRAAAVNSNSQLYKQAGNSVTVDVIKHIAEELKRAEEGIMLEIAFANWSNMIDQWKAEGESARWNTQSDT